MFKYYVQMSFLVSYPWYGIKWWGCILAGVHKTGIRGIQDTRQIVDGKTNDIENNDKKVGPHP